MLENNLEILSDKTERGKERPWRVHKVANEYLAMVYDQVNPDKAVRLRDCATSLIFSVLDDGKKRLKSANFCRVRLCPMCTWRRALKVYSNVVTVLDEMDGSHAFIFLTLTAKNCSGAELSGELDRLMVAWNRFVLRKPFKQAVKGWYRGLEVTHNVNPLSSSYDTFHPHFHCLLAVDKGYFKSRNYLSQESWMDLWQKSLQVDYKPVVDVRRVKGSNSKAVAEAAKYAVKSSDIIIPDDWDLTVDTVRILDIALHNRRLVAFGGLMKEIHKRLNLEDEESGDLVHVEGESPEEKITDRELIFGWWTGYQQYVKA